MRFLNQIPLLPVAAIVVVYALILNGNRGTTHINTETKHSAVVQKARESTSGQILTVENGSGELIRLTIPSIERKFYPGDSIKFNATLKSPSRSDQFENDFASLMKRNGISYIAFAPPDSVTITSTSTNTIWKIKRLQPMLSRILGGTSLNDDTYEFLNAAIIGDTSTLDHDTRTAFSNAGVAHILALSGLHTGIIAAIILFLLSPLNIFGLRKFRIAASLLILWIYAILTGLSPSVTRAVIMATAVGIGYIIGRRNFALNALLLAAIIILLYNPAQIMMPGFQMSFCAAASIIITLPAINLNRKRKLTYYITSAIATTLAATLCTGVIAAIHFHTLPVYFLIANIPTITILPVILGGGILIITLESLSIPSDWLCGIIDLVYKAMFSFIESISRLPGASLQSIHLHDWVLIPYFLTAGLIIFALYRKRKQAYLIASISIAVTIVSFGCSQKKSTAKEHFITKAAGHTCILYRNGNHACVITEAPATIRKEAVKEIERRYSDYLSFHKIDSLTAIADSLAEFDGLKYDGQKIKIQETTFVIAAADSLAADTADYCIIARGFRGDVVKLADKIHADTFLLGSDLDIRRHNRYADSLTAREIPFKSLRQF